MQLVHGVSVEGLPGALVIVQSAIEQRQNGLVDSIFVCIHRALVHGALSASVDRARRVVL